MDERMIWKKGLNILCTEEFFRKTTTHEDIVGPTFNAVQMLLKQKINKIWGNESNQKVIDTDKYSKPVKDIS